ncbi:hypothetical protein, partial [Paraburkholderia sp. BR10954]|uniref:hypothetical protein n=1 Tax=Paraburkholderia sp. BR10954 TaxID=3236995 RepID=UPI0034D310E1
MLLIILFHWLAEIRLLEAATTSSLVWPNFGNPGAYGADTQGRHPHALKYEVGSGFGRGVTGG